MADMSAEAFPLSWPDGWPRTPKDQRRDGGAFKSGQTKFANPPGGVAYSYRDMRPVTFDEARKKLADELERMKVQRVVLSTNVPLRMDGAPRASEAARKLEDPGVAVYFMLKGRPMVIACDRYDTAAANVRSIGLAVQAMRQLERHGGGHMMERAFAGFAALTAPGSKKPWREVFGRGPDWSPDAGALRATFRNKASERHPDAGGSNTLMAELNVAYEDAKRELGL